MEIITNILREHPELAVFLVLAIGFFIGRLTIGNFKLGAMLGTLFAGMIIGQLNIQIAPVVKTIFFDLFLFATGYKVGPQFFYGLKKDALPQLLLTLVICTTCLAVAVIASKFLGYDVGTAAGLLAGAFSESTVIGTASDAIQQLALPDAEKTQLINNIPAAYAVTYLVGTTANVWFLSAMAPKLMKINIREEAKKLVQLFSDDSEQTDDINSAFKDWSLRAYRVTNKSWIGLSIADIEKSFSNIIIERIRSGNKIIEPTKETTINENDIIVVATRKSIMLSEKHQYGEEVFDKDLLDFPIINIDVIMNNNEIAGKRLRDLAHTTHGQGIMLRKLVRGGYEIPIESGTIILKSDVLSISGREHQVERIANTIGALQVNKKETDISFVAIGIVIGGIVGLLSLNIAGISITLSTSGGALLMGLIFGWIHTKFPQHGYIPQAAIWIFDTLGLATFLAIVGLAAGPTFIAGMSQTGVSIIFAGILVALLPHVIGLLFGRFVLNISPLILLGSQAGAGTSTTALKAIQDAANSKIPVIGYTIPYAIGNIILTAWGPVIVSLMTM